MITRFAPSPTGPLHLGHAFSALTAFDLAKASGGTFLLRIEDIDQTRARPEWETQIYDDLHWLGLTWPKPVMRQSQRQEAYSAALDRLWAQGLLYPCTCNRRDIFEAASAPQEGTPSLGPDGIIYPGTCRDRRDLPGWPMPRPHDMTLRLNMRQVLHHRAKDSSLSYKETKGGPTSHKVVFKPHSLLRSTGDVVLARKDMSAAYHLAVVLDDAAQGVTDVVRGSDLAPATQIHVLLQSILNLPTPRFHHHRLIRDEAGRRLAKRDDARAIRLYRTEGATPEDIRRMVGL